MRVKLSDLPPHLRKQAEAQLANSIAVRHPKQEPDRPTTLEPPPEIPQFHQAVHITITVWRARGNFDADNTETKEIIDGLVEAGVISGDTIAQVPRVVKEGHRCKTKKEEKTEILIEEIE